MTGSPTASLGALTPAGSAKATFKVRAGATAGTFAVNATGSGLVSGSLEPWQKYGAYSYSDRIPPHFAHLRAAACGSLGAGRM